MASEYNALQETFRQIRRVATPWCAVETSDYRAAIKMLAEVRVKDEGEPPMVVWDYIGGHRAYSLSEDGNDAAVEAASTLGGAEETAMSPVMLISGAIKLPPRTILFMIVPAGKVLEEDPAMAQAIANLRDSFKGDGRTLVMVGPDIRLPTMVKADVPRLVDPLPDRAKIKEIVGGIYEVAGVAPKGADMERCGEILSGLTHFAVEEGAARSLGKKGMDFKGLGELQRNVIESSTNRALTFEKQSWTFDDMGGLAAFKDFMADLFKGPKAPALIVRVDEIEKSISAAAGGAGGVSDNTGTSQDQLGVLLKTFEDNNWMGLLAVGGPGSGKTLSSICTGNTFGARTLVLDLGATKASLLGESERRIREVMEVLKSIGGEKVLFMATANRLDTLPPELQRRFWLGTWVFPSPSTEERMKIWEIQRKRFNIPENNKTPDDSDWTGSDIRNCCQMSWVTSSSLVTAAKRITVAGKTSKDMVDRLYDLAERSGFLSASDPGVFRRTKVAKASRSITI